MVKEWSRRGVEVARVPTPSAPGIFLLRFAKPKQVDLLAETRALMDVPGVIWAEPNLLVQVELYSTPNDSFFSRQQGLHNAGLYGAVADADIDAPEAWDLNRGNQRLVIAILDTGVDTGHPDLNIFRNDAEYGDGRETNGVDNDGNGYVDDYRGWNFWGGNNNPNPGTSSAAAHGTACAGVAAGIANNSLGVAGAAYNCRILPVKMMPDTGVLTSTDSAAMAIRYAAQFADVISCSWGGLNDSPESMRSAIDYAVTSGRSGKGCAVFCASGNNETLWSPRTQNVRLDVQTGSYKFAFRYISPGQIDGNWHNANQKVAIDSVRLLGQNGYSQLWREDFENGATNWTLAHSSATIGDWSRTSDFPRPTANSQWCFRTPPPTGTVQNDWADLRSPALSLQQGKYVLAYVMLSQAMWGFPPGGPYGRFQVWLFDQNDSPVSELWEGYEGGAGGDGQGLGFPANYANVIAVGASSDLDKRSYYSQYGDGLFCVGPSNGGWNDVATTDTTGSAGANDGAWDSNGDYRMNFGGTSAATPVVAGVAALVLSKNANLAVSQVKDRLRLGCDKIGGVTYDGNGWHREYGYGRVNAYASLQGTSADTTPPTVASVAVRTSRAVEITFSEPMGDGVTTAANYSLSGGGRGTLSAQPASVSWVSGNKFLLEWSAGEMTYGVANVTLTAGVGVKDIAGNGVGVPNAATGNGSEVIHRISCGSRFAEATWPIYPFEAERYWSGVGAAYGPGEVRGLGSPDDGTPMSVYGSERAVRFASSYPGDIVYTLPNVSPGLYHTVRLYFYSSSSYYYDRHAVFDVYVNNTLRLSNFDVVAEAGDVYRGLWRDVAGITALNGCITIRVVPKPTYSQMHGAWYYHATISGIRVTAHEPLVTGVTLNPNATLRSDFDGWVGFRFVVGAQPITVAELGRWVATPSVGTHTVKLVDASFNDIPGGSVAVNTQSRPTGQFTYAALAAPVTLPAGSVCFLVSQEMNGGDAWYNHPDCQLTLGSGATGNGPAWSFNSPAYYYWMVTSPPQSYGPVNLRSY